jgi:hypothetical protein
VVISNILYRYLYINCIFVTRYPDEGHRSDRNVLMKNDNTQLNIIIKVLLLVYHGSEQCITAHIKRHYAISRKNAGSIPDGLIGIFSLT